MCNEVFVIVPPFRHRLKCELRRDKHSVLRESMTQHLSSINSDIIRKPKKINGTSTDISRFPCKKRDSRYFPSLSSQHIQLSWYSLLLFWWYRPNKMRSVTHNFASKRLWSCNIIIVCYRDMSIDSCLEYSDGVSTHKRREGMRSHFQHKCLWLELHLPCASRCTSQPLYWHGPCWWYMAHLPD